jgi:transcriptional regulator with XRE-family HTH domain
MEAASTGDRVRNIRKRRGMTQRQLAQAAGLAQATVKKIEQDAYGSMRLETARKLAVALAVPTTTLKTDPDAPVPSPESLQRWEPVRLALEGVADGVPPDEPTLGGLGAAFRDELPLLLKGKFGDLGNLMPGLLRDADVLVAVSAVGSVEQARTLRAQIRQVAGSFMLHNWQFDAADRAFELAKQDATDPLTAMSVVDEQCWGLIRQGRLTETREAAFAMAAANEPRMTAPRGELASYGRLLTRAAMAAVRDNRPDEAADALKLARMAAVGAGPDFVLPHSPWHVFGPVTISVFAAENAMIQDRPDAVLSIARRLRRSRPAIPLSVSAPSFSLDIACAHAMLRNDEKAVAVLRQLRDSRPEWFPRQRYAADILEKIIRHRRTLTAEIRELADVVRLPL